MQDTTRVRSSVKKLIEINRKRFANYREAARQFTTLELKALFMNFALQSVRFRKDLYQWIEESEAKIDSSTDNAEENSGVSRNSSREFSFSNFVVLEEEALRIYQAVLATSFFPLDALKQIDAQVKEIEGARNVFKVIRGGLSKQLNAA